MHANSRLAVELTKGEDFLNIWVDANDNGVRDDDDVNIFVTRSGGFFAESPTFKAALDAHLKQRLQEASVALMVAGHDNAAEDAICELALQLVVKACQEPAPVAEQPVTAEPVDPSAWSTQLSPLQTQAEPAWHSDVPLMAEPAPVPELNEFGIPLWKPQA